MPPNRPAHRHHVRFDIRYIVANVYQTPVYERVKNMSHLHHKHCPVGLGTSVGMILVLYILLVIILSCF